MNNIALSFSGGGFRAAAYSLGCLAYLNQLELNGQPVLRNVKYISSTSGGSLTNLVYSSGVFNGKPFDETFRQLSQAIEGDALLAEALHILNSKSAWKDRKGKSRNLINAFSIAYDRLLCQQNFGIFSTTSQQPHLEEICVNATEFTNGLPFRFQSQPEGDFPRGKIGNSYIYFLSNRIATAHQIRLADILASSSCFPSGFEPMIFPNDYSNKSVSEKELMEALSYTANEFTIESYNHLSFLKNDDFDKNCQFGVMDGGIDDNQAIDAFLKADDRRRDNGLPAFDLFISCDVASPFMDGYTLPVQKPKWYDFLSINALLVLGVLLSLWLPYLLVFKKGPWASWEYVTGTLSGIFTLVLLLFLLRTVKKLFKAKTQPSTWGLVFGKYKWQFGRLSLGFVKQMISSRMKSIFILSNEIYLKQIRRMYYDKLFSQDAYKDRVIQNTIYDLSQVNVKKHQLHPTQVLIDTAEKARTMGTTLWFDTNHQRDKVKEAIIATGKFTTCYNLLLFLNEKSQATPLNADELQLQAQLQQDWTAFGKNPFH